MADSEKRPTFHHNCLRRYSFIQTWLKAQSPNLGHLRIDSANDNFLQVNIYKSFMSYHMFFTENLDAINL